MAYEVYVTCDKCGLTYHWKNHTVKKSTAELVCRSNGWQVGKLGWFCSSCRTRKKVVKK